MLKAVDTAYKGYRFRSRLEARWAYFWDQVGTPWRYEVEGFDLGEVRYLPDFWLTEHQAWVEIKGEIRNDRAGIRMLTQCGELARQSAHPVILCFLDPMDARCALFRPNGRMYSQCRWGACEQCGYLGLMVHSDDQRQSCFLCPKAQEHTGNTSNALFHRRRLYNAALAARQNRFVLARA